MTIRCLVPPSMGAARAKARAEMLEHVLTVTSGEDASVIVAGDYAELGERLARGEAELGWAPAAVLARLEAADVVFRAAYKVRRRRRSTYRSAIVVRADSPYERPSDLRGARPAWVDPLSLGGCLLALQHLRQHGVEPGDLGAVWRPTASMRRPRANTRASSGCSPISPPEPPQRKVRV